MNLWILFSFSPSTLFFFNQSYNSFFHLLSKLRFRNGAGDAALFVQLLHLFLALEHELP
jgi:hypothetical protein